VRAAAAARAREDADAVLERDDRAAEFVAGLRLTGVALAPAEPAGTDFSTATP